jgi:hypothetical protein
MIIILNNLLEFDFVKGKQIVTAKAYDDDVKFYVINFLKVFTYYKNRVTFC